jgi:Fe-S-cluster containining protein
MFNIFKKKKNNIKIIGECLSCGRCCQNLILIHKKQPIKNIEQFQSLLKTKPFYKNLTPLYEDKKDGFLYFSCRKLGSNKKCSDYKKRPKICRTYPQTLILEYGGKLLPNCGYQIVPEKSFQKILKEF